MSKLRDAAQQALEALEDHAKQYPHMQKGYTVDAITALRTALAEQPEQEPVEATPYNLKRIAWELERTALGDGFYGNALRVAKDIPGITPEDRSVLDRYATGTQTGTDHVHLQWLAQRLYNKDECAPEAPQPAKQPLTDEFLRKLHHIDEFGLFCDYDDFEQIARAIEAAHGIGEKT